jgi:hypothetical protein
MVFYCVRRDLFNLFEIKIMRIITGPCMLHGFSQGANVDGMGFAPAPGLQRIATGTRCRSRQAQGRYERKAGKAPQIKIFILKAELGTGMYVIC